VNACRTFRAERAQGRHAPGRRAILGLRTARDRPEGWLPARVEQAGMARSLAVVVVFNGTWL
jgi:hypothetical protein